MTNSKSTKRALLTSALAIALCVTMLVGTTFAWFTDTASTGVNKIQAGNLDVKLEYRNADTADFTEADKDTPVFKEGALWEPGHVEYVVLRVSNAGSLALKYKLGVNISGETGSTNVNGDAFKLSDYIRFAVLNDDQSSLGRDALVAAAADSKLIKEGYTAENHLAKGESKTVTLVVWMPTTVGNEANHKTEVTAPSIDLGIRVVATQYTHESDSFGNQYDKDATYPVTDAASVASAVADLANPGNKNVVVTVANNMDNTSGIKTAKGNALTMDLNGKSVGVSYGQGSTNTTTNGMQLLQGSTVTLKNGTYKANHGNDADHNIAILIQNYSNLTIENCTLDMREANDTAGNSRGTSYALSTNCGKVVIKGDTNIYARKNTEYALDVMHWENTGYADEGTSVTFDETMTGIVDGKIDVYCYRNNRVVKPVDDGGAVLTIMGGTFVNSGLTLEQFKAFVPTGYTVTTNADGSFTVSK